MSDTEPIRPSVLVLVCRTEKSSLKHTKTWTRHENSVKATLTVLSVYFAFIVYFAALLRHKKEQR